MKTTLFKTAFAFAVIFLVSSCQSTSANPNLSYIYEDKTTGDSIHPTDDEYFIDNSENTTAAPPTLSLQEKRNNIGIYNRWTQYAITVAQAFMNNAQIEVQQAQQIINNQRQLAQFAGYDPQIENQMAQAVQQAQTTYQINQYIFTIAQEQAQLLQSINNNPNLLQNDQLFAQVTSFNAVLLYMYFGRGYGQTFEQALQPATRWYFSPQCEIDIKNGIVQMSANNQTMARINRSAPTVTGSSILSDDRHRQRFSDAMLDQKSWVNPENGDVYQLPNSIENPTINGNDMKAY